MFSLNGLLPFELPSVLIKFGRTGLQVFKHSSVCGSCAKQTSATYAEVKQHALLLFPKKWNATNKSLWFHYGEATRILQQVRHSPGCDSKDTIEAVLHSSIVDLKRLEQLKELHVGYKSPNELKIGPGYISDGPKTWKIATIMTVSYSFHQLHPSLQLSPHFGRNHHSWVPGRKHPSTAKEWLVDTTSTYLFI